MGLDMYLSSAPKIAGMSLDSVLEIGRNFDRLKQQQYELYEIVKPHIKHFEEFGHSWDSIVEEVIYWRKANQIHNWFVENLHDGVDEPLFREEVTKENLQELYKLCVKALKHKTKPKIHPSSILPTRPGCFFGSISYDNFYYHVINETKTKLEDVLKNFDFDTHFLFYECSW